MKGTVWALTLVLSLCVAIGAQEKAESPCPNISVNGPAGVVPPGGIETFIVNLENFVPFKATYEWTLSAGMITNGQGTASIIVQAPPDGSVNEIMATIGLGGLPAQCSAVATGRAAVAARPSCSLPDIWGRLRRDDERVRLQSAAMLLRHNPNTFLVFVPSLAANETYSHAQRRASFIRNYLVGNHLVSADKIQIAFRNHEPRETMAFVLPPGELTGTLKAFEANQSLESVRPAGKSH